MPSAKLSYQNAICTSYSRPFPGLGRWFSGGPGTQAPQFRAPVSLWKAGLSVAYMQSQYWGRWKQEDPRDLLASQSRSVCQLPVQ